MFLNFNKKHKKNVFYIYDRNHLESANLHQDAILNFVVFCRVSCQNTIFDQIKETLT